jgi:hypothetical protein
MDKYDKDARDGAGKYRGNNPMPPGTQAQHWTKVRSARAAGLSTSTMNRNLSPLQSRNNLPATTLLTDPKGKGTRYTVKGGPSYGNEHKFADRFLINKERANIRAANPNVSEKAAVVAAGESARWKMTGHPGTTRYTSVRSTYRQGPGQGGDGPKPPPSSPPSPPRSGGPPRPSGPQSPSPAGPARPSGPKPGAMNAARALPKAGGPKAVGSMNTASKMGAGTSSINSAARVSGVGTTLKGFGGIR